MKRYFAFFAVSFAISLFVINIFGFTTSVCIALCSIFAVLTLALTLTQYKKQAIAGILGLSVALCWFPLYLNLTDLPQLQSTKVEFMAIAKGFSFDNNLKTGIVCDLDVKSPNNFTARIYFNDKNLELSPGDIVRGECKFEIPVNDEDFNAFTYYKTRGIDVIGFCNDSVTIERNTKFNIKYLPQYISNVVSERVKQLLPKRNAGLVNAVLLGDKTDFTLKDQNNFSSAGLAHVVAVSGMHLAFLANLMIFIFGRKLSAFISIPILILFTLVVGAPPSIVRALIMQIMFISATIIKREADSVTSLCIAMFVILFCNPYTVLDIGFQLSFSATLGLIIYSGKFNNLLISHIKIKNKRIKRAIAFFASTLSGTLSAILFTTPIIFWNFKVISIVAPISNLLLIWAVTALFYGSITGIAISFVSINLGQIVMCIVDLISDFIIFCSDFLAKLPFAEIFVDNIFVTIFAIYIYTMIFFFTKTNKKKFIIPGLAVLFVLIVTIILNFATEERSSFKGIRFSVLDVGQGASLVADYNDSCVVVDCGGSRSINAGNITSKYIKKIKSQNIDILILTHMHSDHVNGAKRLIEQMEVLNLYVPIEAKEDDVFKNIAESANRCGTEIHYVSNETQLKLNGMECIIYPTGWSDVENEQGLVTVLKKGDFELIVTGDLEQKSEELLCEKYELFDTEVYVTGHHGSDTSSSLKLMNRILPELAVVSVGADNYYGHPHKRTLDLFNNMGIAVRRTDTDGDIVFYSDKFVKGGN